MSIDQIKETFRNLKKNPKRAISYLIVAGVCYVFGAFSNGYFGEMGRQFATSKITTGSIKMEIPVDEKMQHTPYNLKNEVGGRFVGSYISADDAAVVSVQRGDISNLSVIPIKKIRKAASES